ncbi:MEKHLA domain-containing protein [Pseudomonas sp. CCM 7891]|uniref:MEKHLA domain-containing protein n=1 Tax=Pseudomonas karstica TaxID=1055468 RepID=A0A7X2RS66_9PSED|nr:MEKHLA domain-containing protein [Pseudomonas karstica]MTD18970.1 MEKHLA domain-containing protein [Pseudomonas karstica]
MLDESYRHWTGHGLLAPSNLDEPQRLTWLHEQAPYSLLAHDGAADPRFTYANACALACFKYPREAFIGMPSRFSASELDRVARQVLLEQVTAQGIAQGYSGWRVDAEQQPFMIYAGVVWTLLDEAHKSCGQAALFWPDEQRIGVLA